MTELVDHDAVVSERRLDKAGSILDQLVDAADRRDATDHRSGQFERLSRPLARRLKFQDRAPLEPVHGNVEAPAVREGLRKQQ